MENERKTWGEKQLIDLINKEFKVFCDKHSDTIYKCEKCPLFDYYANMECKISYVIFLLKIKKG